MDEDKPQPEAGDDEANQEAIDADDDVVIHEDDEACEESSNDGDDDDDDDDDVESYGRLQLYTDDFV